MYLNNYLGGDEGEVSGIGAGGGAALAPVEEAESVRGVSGDAEGVDQTGGEHGLFEAVGSTLAVEGGEDEADSAEVVAGGVDEIDELAEMPSLRERTLAPQHRFEHAAEDAESHRSVRHFGRPAIFYLQRVLLVFGEEEVIESISSKRSYIKIKRDFYEKN